MRIRQQIGEVSGTIFTDTFVVVCCFLFPSIYEIHWRGLEKYRAAPSTLVALSHKRDNDIVIIGTWTHFKKTFFHNQRRPHFAAREDLFQPGFLDYHFMFRFIQGHIIHRINVAPFLRSLRAHPISHIVNKRVAPLIRDAMNIEGDVKLGDVLNQTGLDDFAKQLPAKTAKGLAQVRLSTFLGYKYRCLHDHLSDSGIFKNGLSHKIREQCLKQIDQQIGVFANILDKGGVCMVAPEGDLSPDGSFVGVKSGLHRILARTKNTVTIQPVNVTYDFMTMGRIRLYLNVGDEFEVNHLTSRMELDDKVRLGIVAQSQVTMGQIGSEYFLRKLEADDINTDIHELREAIGQRIQSLKKTGLNFDERLLTCNNFEKRLADFIAYCVKHKILLTYNNSFIINRTVETPENDFRFNPVRYSYNELNTFLNYFPVLAEQPI